MRSRSEADIVAMLETMHPVMPGTWDDSMPVPCFCLQHSGNADFSADGTAYQAINMWTAQLITAVKDPAAIKAVKQAINGFAGGACHVQTMRIGDEKAFRTDFEFTTIGEIA